MYYHPPSTLEPLDNDEDNSGKPTDHLTVIWKPLTNENPSKSKFYKSITYRPFPESGIREMGHDVYMNTNVDNFEKLLIKEITLYFPEKNIRINEMDKIFNLLTWKDGVRGNILSIRSMLSGRS